MRSTSAVSLLAPPGDRFWGGALTDDPRPSFGWRPAKTRAEDPTALEPQAARLEAALFSASGPVSAGRLAKAATLENAKAVHRLVPTLNASYDAARRSFRVERTAAGYQLLTRPPFAYWLKRLHPRQADLSLSPAMLETLTIISYRQPVTRAEVEAVRGVASMDLMRQLLDRGFVEIVGEDDSLGRPFLYGTTTKFLDAFDMDSIEELPGHERLAG